MDDSQQKEHARGGRPRVSAGRITVRLPEDLLNRLYHEDSITDTIRRALTQWYRC